MGANVFSQKLGYVLSLFTIFWAYPGHSMEPDVPVLPVHEAQGENISDVCSLFPCTYKHKDVQSQLKAYRAIYDNIPNRGEGVFSGVHIPGLFDVLKNGFALVGEFIKKTSIIDYEKETKDSNSSGNTTYVEKEKPKEVFFKTLEKLYHIALILENSQKMTQENFLKFNILLAVFVDTYKNVDFDDYRSTEAKRENEVACPGEEDEGGIVSASESKEESEEEDDDSDDGDESILYSLQEHELGYYNTVSQVEALMNQEEFFTEDWWLTRDEDGNIIDEQFSPPAIIYTNLKKTGISPSTFVDQMLDESYGMGIALFKVESFPIPKPLSSAQYRENQTHRPAHGGVFSGTYNLLTHDLQHMREQYQIEYKLKENYNLDWRENLYRINQIRNKNVLDDPSYRKTPVYQILTDGLFLLSHEFFNITQGNLFLWIEELDKISFSRLLSLIKFTIMGSIFDLKGQYCWREETEEKDEQGKPIYKIREGIKQLHQRHSLYYRQELKDHEFILKGKSDINYRPFLPDNFATLTPRKKEKAIMRGYQNFWHYFMLLAKGK